MNINWEHRFGTIYGFSRTPHMPPMAARPGVSATPNWSGPLGKYSPGTSDDFLHSTFSGADISIIFNIPLLDRPSITMQQLPIKMVADLQTLSISSTTSIAPVRRVGEAKPANYGKGARTFAGTMVFTLIGQDPFMELYSIDALNSSVGNDGKWHIDQMPPFDAIIVGVNEMGGAGVQIIHGIVLSHWGTTYSIDDMYSESSYTYVADHVTPFITTPLGTLRLFGLVDELMSRRGATHPQTVDDAPGISQAYSFRNRTVGAKSAFEQPYTTVGSTVPDALQGAFTNALNQAMSPGQLLMTSLYGPEIHTHGMNWFHDSNLFGLLQ